MKTTLESIWNRIERRYKISLICSFGVGIISQGMGLFNKYSVNDDPMNYGVGKTLPLGRWMLEVFARLEVLLYGDGHYSLPTFNDFLAIVFIAITACLLIYMLDIEKEYYCGIIGALMVCFPVVTSMFGYMFTIHFYMLALMLGVAGVVCVCKENRNWIWCAGVLMMTASAGIYQAFIPTIITAGVLYLIKYVIDTSELKLCYIRVVRVFGSFISFILIYFVVNRVVLNVSGVSLSEYKGINVMGKGSLSEYALRVLHAYKDFFLPLPYASYNMYLGRIDTVYKIVILFTLFLSIMLLVKVFKMDRMKAVLLFILMLLIPLCSNFIVVMVNRAEIHSLMVYGGIFPFIYVIWLTEQVRSEEYAIATKRLNSFIEYSLMVLMGMLILLYSRVDNKCYLKATYAQQEAISYFTMLVTHIKSTDGYMAAYPVTFVDADSKSDSTITLSDYGMMDNLQYVPYGLDTNGYINCYSWVNFMKQWTGYNPSIVDSRAYETLDEVKAMPHYPDDGAIRVIDETVVVKF